MLRGLEAKTRYTALALIGVTTAFAGYTGVQSFRGGSIGSAQAGEIVIHIAGAVRNPGVHYARDGMIVEDALRLAGGETEESDLSQINLAAKVQPNSQIYVPVKGEFYDRARLGIYAATASGSGRSGASSKSEIAAAGGVINVNTASKTDLESLPGIGPVTAQRILDYRMNVGIFNTVDDLLAVKGIGPKKLEQIRPFVVVR